MNAYVDILGLDVICSRSSYRFFVVYRPPDSSRVYENIGSQDYMSDVALGIERNINTKGPTIIVGDFNCPDLVWDCGSVPTDATSLQLYSFATSNGFVQVVKEPTRGGNMIDLVFTNQPFLMSTVNTAAPFSTSDHNSVSFAIAVEHGSSAQTQESSKRIYLWKQGDYAGMSHYLTNYDWSYMISIHLTRMTFGEPSVTCCMMLLTCLFQALKRETVMLVKDLRKNIHPVFVFCVLGNVVCGRR